MSRLYPLPTPVSSRSSTPSQTPRPLSPSQNQEVMTDPLFPDTEDDNPPAQDPPQPAEVDTSLLGPFLELQSHYFAEVERRVGERQAEYTRQHERAIASLQAERDTAQANLVADRARAETTVESLEAQITGLQESVSELEAALEERTASITNLKDQLDKTNNQLSESEAIKHGLLRCLARTENEHNDLRDQLTDVRRQIDMAHSTVNEERSRNDNYRAELATATNKVQDMERESIAIQGQLRAQIDELTTFNHRLREDLRQAMRDAELLDTMRRERDDLNDRYQILQSDFSSLTDDRRVQQDTIDALKGQRDAMGDQLRCLGGELHDEQVQKAELQVSLSSHLRELRELSNQRDSLQNDRSELTNTNAELRARCEMREAEIMELKLKASERERVRAKIPRYPALVRYKDTPPKTALVQPGVATINNWP